MRPIRLLGCAAAVLLAVFPAIAQEGPKAAKKVQGVGGSPSEVRIIDTHAHIARNNARRDRSPLSFVSDALRAMDAAGIETSILMPPPFPRGQAGAYGWNELRGLMDAHPGRFGIAAGGESLNGMIVSTKPENVSPASLDAFRKEAIRLADAGIAGYGELAVEHLSSGQGQHPYVASAPDHPMLRALADVAAERGLPLDIHMESVPRNMPTPNRFKGGENPPQLTANIAAFKRLLDHNRTAKIVWVHAGWDLTGERSVGLMRSLLSEHQNLYMSIKIDRGGNPRNNPMSDGDPKDDWLDLLRAFPDRFTIGSDQFYDGELTRLNNAMAFLRRLPPDLARKVGRENALAIYRIAGK